jgi:uracil phosphoribosyltransferase
VADDGSIVGAKGTNGDPRDLAELRVGLRAGLERATATTVEPVGCATRDAPETTATPTPHRMCSILGDGTTSHPKGAGPTREERRPPVALHVVDHPLAHSLLTALRDRSTPPPLFRVLSKRLALVLCIEATRSAATETVEVETPIKSTTGRRIASTFVAVPILRAGLGMLEAVTELFPEVPVGYIGLERDHATFEPSLYYSKLPPLQGRLVLLLDPMLATGGSATAACAALFQAGARNVSLVSVVSAPEGVRHLTDAHPSVEIYTAALDEGLNEHAYIVPGLGDFGDRLFGT